jgi:hypothetical protein
LEIVDPFSILEVFPPLIGRFCNQNNTISINNVRRLNLSGFVSERHTYLWRFAGCVSDFLEMELTTTNSFRHTCFFLLPMVVTLAIKALIYVSCQSAGPHSPSPPLCRWD